MSKPRNSPPPASPDGATPIGAMALSGVVKTSKGFAVATATIAADGSLSWRLGVSQRFKEFIVKEHYRAQSAQAMKV